MAVSDWLIFGLCFVFVFRVEVKRGRQWDLSKPVWKKMRTASLLLKAQMWWSWMGGSARRHGWQYVKLQPGHLSWMTQQRLCSAAGSTDAGRSGTPSQDSPTASPSAPCACSRVSLGQELGELHLCLGCWFPSLRNTGKGGAGAGSSTKSSEEAFCHPGRRVALEYLFTI